VISRKAFSGVLARIVLAVSLLFAVPVLAAGSTKASDPGGSDRQILVMLRLSPDHYRPNSSYGGSYGDGLTASMRRGTAKRIARRYHLALVGDGWPMPALGVDCFVMRVPDGESVASAADRVSHDPAISWSQPMQVFQAQAHAQAQAQAQGQTQGAPGSADPLFAAQPDATLWHLANLHRIATGRGVTVAVIDSMIDTTHPDLAGQLMVSEDFVTGHPSSGEQHGTGIAGVIAAQEGNGIGIAGVAPGARLMALRACWQTSFAAGGTLCDTLSLAKAMQFAINHHADIVNLSLAGPGDQLLGRLIGMALQRHMAVVAAYDDKLPDGGFPASARGVIAVANQDMASLPAGVYGAPGRDVLTTQPGGKWFLVNGSSFAAAHVSGLIALIQQKHGPETRAILVATRSTGGIVDACASLLGLHRPCNCGCTSAQVAASGR
jgi:subtilisin family serine protease